MKATSNTFYDAEVVSLNDEQEREQEELEEELEQEEEQEEELDEELDEEDEMLAMWLEKLNRPGRLVERGGIEVTKEEILKMFADEREEAMSEILAMSAKEFQTRLFDGTLPEFVREKLTGIYHDTCHPIRIMTERDFALNIACYGNVHRKRLRYMSTECYKIIAYGLH